MGEIELLSSNNRDSFYKGIPKYTLRDRVYKRVKSLKNNVSYYILEGDINNRSLYCYIDYGHMQETAKVFYWELQEIDCYVDKDFKIIKLKNLIELLNN